jgi:hypothetical protein
MAAYAATIVLLAFALWEWRAARAAREALGSASTQYQAEVGEMRSVSRRLQSAEEKWRELHGGAAPALRQGDGASASSAASPKDPGAAGQKADAQRFLELYPQAREIIRSMGRARYEAVYASFQRSAGLNPAQVEQLENATLDTWMQNLALTLQGGIRSTANQPPEAQGTGILGDQGFQQLQDYNRALPAQNLVVEVATGAGFANAPLSPEQASQVAKIVTDNSPSYQAGQRVNLSQVDWNAALAALPTTSGLSPPQEQAAERVFLTRQYQANLSQAQARSP